MKLGDILSLKSMRFMDEPREKDIKVIRQKPNLLQGFPIEYFKGNPPPQNDSSKVKIELRKLSDLPHDIDFVKEMDAIDKVFKNYCDIQGLDFPQSLVDQLLDDSRIFTRTLKIHYNRPRPYQVADHPLVKIDIGKEAYMESMNTPSYPSGHSCQGILIAKVMSDMYPDHEYNFMSLGRDISRSRNIGRAHYETDSKFGMKLGYSMYDYLKKMKRL